MQSPRSLLVQWFHHTPQWASHAGGSEQACVCWFWAQGSSHVQTDSGKPCWNWCLSDGGRLATIPGLPYVMTQCLGKNLDTEMPVGFTLTLFLFLLHILTMNRHFILVPLMHLLINLFTFEAWVKCEWVNECVSSSFSYVCQNSDTENVMWTACQELPVWFVYFKVTGF